MGQTKRITAVAACMGMLALILDGKTALEGGQAGISVCLRTVIPSLFPFFLLSVLLTGSTAGATFPIPGKIRQMLGIPPGAESILLCGFLGGYPVGAQSVAALYRQGKLPKGEAERMLCFCSNAGPAFIFGMAASLFPDLRYAWCLWGIHMFSALIVRLFFPAKSVQPIHMDGETISTLPQALYKSTQIMATVCGWVVLFRIGIAFLDRWALWLLPSQGRLAIIGLLELANGCVELAALPQLSQRFLLCAGMLSFGGLCVAMQTVSVTQGLSLRYYFLGKIMQGLFSLLFAWGLISGVGWGVGSAIGAIGILAHLKISGSIPAKCDV